MNPAEPVDIRLQQLQADQALILDQVDNAIALFDRDRRLILFNQKLVQIWGLSGDWLATQPRDEEVLRAIAEAGTWSDEQRQQLQQMVTLADAESASMSLVQRNGIYLEISATHTSEDGRLLNFRDVTARQAQISLNTELQRLTFLVGLTQRLQSSEELREIGRFALSYLVQVMNAAFGDVKVIRGIGSDRQAQPLVNQITAEFIATFGEPAVAEMQTVLDQGIPHGEGLLWQVVATGKPLFVENYADHPEAVSGLRHPAIGQLGIFPIPASGGAIIGVLTLECRALQKLQDAPQQDMVQAACQTLGVAIERAQAQEQLQQINIDLERSSQLKSEFLASMSHELRTPLNSILGFSELLQRQVENSLTPRQISHVRAIESSGQHLLQLLNDILDLSKIEVGKAEIELEPVSVQDLCRECLRMIQPRADKKRLLLSLELDYRLNQAALDERRVRQMVVNLLANAVKFTPETGTVKLSGKLAFGNQLAQDFRPDRSPINPSTPYLCLEVLDSGIGIPADKRHLLFQPFQQIDATLTRRHEGTGLGLALTKRLAELHGGTVSFQPAPGQGSIFRIWLPLTEMRQSFTVEQEPIAPPTSPWLTEARTGNQQRILVVEDHPYNQVLISELLELEGYIVELISDGQTMLDAIHSDLVSAKSLPDLILMDIQLPFVDGLELIRQLKAHPLWQQVPVVAVTAMAMRGDRDRCFAAGADAYLSKPLKMDDVLAQVRSLI
jgi:two-component system, sensor histidine kinase